MRACEEKGDVRKLLEQLFEIKEVLRCEDFRRCEHSHLTAVLYGDDSRFRRD